MGRCRIVIQKILPERIGNWRQAHRRAGVSGVRLLDRIDRKSSDGINTKLVDMTLLAHGVSGAGVGDTRELAQALDAPPGERASGIVLQKESGVCPVIPWAEWKKWCGWSDSNRQRGNPQRILSPPRMPISPQPHRAFTRQQQNSTQARRLRSERFAAGDLALLANPPGTPKMREEEYFLC